MVVASTSNLEVPNKEAMKTRGKNDKNRKSNATLLRELMTFHELTDTDALLYKRASNTYQYLLLSVFICGHDDESNGESQKFYVMSEQDSGTYRCQSIKLLNYSYLRKKVG